MKRLAFAALLTMVVSMAAPRTEAIVVIATSDVIAMNCCTVGTVHIYNGLTIKYSTSMWENESFSHLWLATAVSCDQTYSGRSASDPRHLDGCDAPPRRRRSARERHSLKRQPRWSRVDAGAAEVPATVR